MQIVVPMAGAGQRYTDAGYTTPKPLILVAGVPMVVRAVRDLPDASKVVFVCQEAHVEEHAIDEVLRCYFPTCEIVTTDGLTAGQACTVRLAADALDPTDTVTVAACDNTHVYDAERLMALLYVERCDGVVWTYRREPRVALNPEMYGWVRTGEDDTEITGVSVKAPISGSPTEDHVVPGKCKD